MEFRNLHKQYLHMNNDINDAILKVLNNSDYILGESVKELERVLEKYVGIKHCITCANGTDALMLALMTWGVGSGDAVFVPDFTFFASGETPAFLGATPVFVDVDIKSFNISTEKLEKAIHYVLEHTNLRPRVVLAVDLFGQPANYGAIRTIANKYGLLVLEDGAQGFGGKIEEKKACGFGDISTTSFFPAKPLGCYGDGGAIFTDNDEWADIIRSLTVHGKGVDKYDNIRIGMNSRLDTIQAAILLVKLKHFMEHELEEINEVANLYYTLLQGVINVPVIESGLYSSWAQYTIICKDSIHRGKIQNALKKENIPTAVYYPKGLHEQRAFEKCGLMVDEYNDTMYLKDRVLSLPMSPYIEKQEVKRVAELIQSNTLD